MNNIENAEKKAGGNNSKKNKIKMRKKKLGEIIQKKIKLIYVN